MRRSRRTLVVVLAAAAPIVACSLTTSFDDLTGGLGTDAAVQIVYIEAGSPVLVHADAASSLVDATGDADDAMDSADGAFDADADDAEPVDLDARADAAIDAGPDAGWCLNQPGHTLCSDFDEGNVVFGYTDSGAQWQSLTYGTGVLGLTSTAAVPIPSRPSAFLSTLTTADAQATQSAAQLIFVIPTTTSKVELYGQMLLSQTSALQMGSAATLFVQQMATGNVYTAASIQWDTTGLTFVNSAITDAGRATTVQHALPFSASWQNVHLVVTRHPVGHVLLTIDGNPLVNQDTQTVSPNVQTLTVGLGLSSTVSTPNIAVLFDDVTVDVTP